MTDILCLDCGYVRETTEKYPTLVMCEKCGSHNLAYEDEAKEQFNTLE